MSNKSKFIAQGAVVVGDVTLEAGSSIWYNAVLRADEGWIYIGENTNIQDNCTVHSEAQYPVKVGRNVTVGHNAIIHGCTIGDDCLIGMGAIIMNGAQIGSGSMIGAGALVTGGKVIPEGSLVMGSPAKVVRQLDDHEREMIRLSAEEYEKLADKALESTTK